MATQSKKFDTFSETPISDSIKELGFDVIVEQVIGTVVPDDTLKNGRTTTEAAFELIAKYIDTNSEHGSPFKGGTFRFDLGDGDVVYTIDVTSFDRSESA